MYNILMDSEGRRIPGEAAKAREDGRHLDALQLGDSAMLAYKKDGDKLGFGESVAERSLVLRHIADEENDDRFLRLARAELTEAVDWLRQENNLSTVALPVFNLAKVQEELGQLDEAVKNYQEALTLLENNPPEPHGKRPAMIADAKIHLATCEYQFGDKSGLERAEQGLVDLEAADEEKYNKDVWLSGGHMRIASMLREDNPKKAQEHLQKAKEIIDANRDLKLRAQQWQKLSASFT